MNKTITYTGLIVAAIMLVVAFMTAKTYTQLGIATVLYPPVAFLMLKAFPKRSENQTTQNDSEIPLQTNTQTPLVSNIDTSVNTEQDTKVDIADIDKRAFLKLIGGAGVTFFLLSLFSKKATVPFLGQISQPDTTSIRNADGSPINPAERQPLDGYQITEIDDGLIAYYGYTNRNGGWMIMKHDSESMSFRYASGDSDFSQNWASRGKLPYDYFHNIF